MGGRNTALHFGDILFLDFKEPGKFGYPGVPDGNLPIKVKYLSELLLVGRNEQGTPVCLWL